MGEQNKVLNEENGALKEEIQLVKESLKEHLTMVQAILGEGVGAEEDEGDVRLLRHHEHEALKLLQGVMLELLDSLPEAEEAAMVAQMEHDGVAAPAATPPTAAAPAATLAAEPAAPPPPPAAPPPPATARVEAPPPAERTSKSVRAGDALKVKLVAVVKLRYSGKKGSTAATNEILEAIPNGNVPFSNLDKLAKSLEVQLFRVGGFATIKAVLDKLLKRSLSWCCPRGRRSRTWIRARSRTTSSRQTGPRRRSTSALQPPRPSIRALPR